jgi:Arm DNA-binding domain
VGRLTEETIRAWVQVGEHFEIRSAEPGSGLHLVWPARNKTPAWAFRFKEGGATHKLRIGLYPEMGLEQAREVAASYRKMIENGESVIAAIGNKRAGGDEAQLARTFSALLRDASRHGAKRMTITIDFEVGDSESWAS